MGQYSQFEDLIELVQQEPGWRIVEANGSGAFRIMPADKAIGVIHVSRCTGGEPLEAIKCKLRRAGFKPLMKESREIMTQTTAKPTKANGSAQHDEPKPRDLIAEARAHVSVALDALAGLDRILGEIAGEQDSVTKIKQLLQQVLK